MAVRPQMQQAIENFMFHHKNGESIREIAERYGVSYDALLNHLGKIAEANGVKRVSLLQYPQKSHIGHIAGKPFSRFPLIISSTVSHSQPDDTDSNPVESDPPISKRYIDTVIDYCNNLIEETDILLNSIKEEF